MVCVKSIITIFYGLYKGDEGVDLARHRRRNRRPR